MSNTSTLKITPTANGFSIQAGKVTLYNFTTHGEALRFWVANLVLLQYWADSVGVCVQNTTPVEIAS